MNHIHIGDTLEGLKTFADQSVQMCVTSPPYFGLRSYLPTDHAQKHEEIGLEETPDAYIARLVAVFREVRRVLKDDGTLWVNIGDSYARTGGTDRKVSDSAKVGSTRNTLEQMGDRKQKAPDGIKEKDLIGIPWLLAFALRADGWYLRQDIIWHKPNPMPESVKDRCTKAHEYVFLLSKSDKYFFDSEAMREPATHAGKRVSLGAKSMSKGQAKGAGVAASGNGTAEFYDVPEFRNRRSVWTVATKPYSGAHFAVFPPALIEPCILAGSRPGDVVLDPFMGSGTTAEVALRADRQYAGCEIDERCVALQEARINSVFAEEFE